MPVAPGEVKLDSCQGIPLTIQLCPSISPGTCLRVPRPFQALHGPGCLHPHTAAVSAPPGQSRNNGLSQQPHCPAQSMCLFLLAAKSGTPMHATFTRFLSLGTHPCRPPVTQ